MTKNPVVLVHGITDKNTIFQEMSDYLTNLGWSVHSINLSPNDGSEKLEALAAQVARYIDQVFLKDRFIDLVGFSMGGLVTRYYLQRLGGIKRVQRYISISAPNHGTITAYSLPYEGVLEMRPRSEFLEDLERDSTDCLSKINCTTIWTPFDLMIVPPESSIIVPSKQFQVPVLVHAWMVKDARVLKLVKEALLEPIRTD
jgi:triacylglycerol lipase